MDQENGKRGYGGQMMIDIKVQEVFDYFIKEALWRDTIIPGVQWYYAESELYVFRFPAGYHYGFCFIHAKSPEDAGKYFVDKFWAEHNKPFASGDALRALRGENKALKAENEMLKDRLERFRKVLHDVAVMANNDDLEQIFEKCRDVLRDVYLEEKFQKSFSEILHSTATPEKGGEDE